MCGHLRTFNRHDPEANGCVIESLICKHNFIVLFIPDFLIRIILKIAADASEPSADIPISKLFSMLRRIALSHTAAS
jgi:hypothetical protein